MLTHTPPSMLPFSTIATRLPSLAAAMAAFCPPGPEPITTRSYSIGSVIAYNYRPHTTGRCRACQYSVNNPRTEEARWPYTNPVVIERDTAESIRKLLHTNIFRYSHTHILRHPAEFTTIY